MSKANILVVEDQDSIRHFVVKALEDEGHVVRGVDCVREARKELEKDMPDLAFFDLKLPDGSGLDLLKEVKRLQPEVAVVLMTAFGELETAVEAMSAGAYWFMKKPFEQEELLALAGRALESQKMFLELRRLRHQAFSDDDFLHSSSPAMQETYAIAEQVARGDTTSVLIEGESGTGKEYFANLIHRMSARHAQPFIEINCAAIPSELLESELFGHEKGAFTDARAQKLGLMEMANGGTLFLDEIGELAPMLQVKLLRVLERRTFRRVGGTKDISVSLRVISATNQDLEKMVREGGFREDLYYRLRVVPLLVPPLRDRREDVLPLARLFVERYAKQFKKPFRGISDAAERMLTDYHWPGNIRELENIVERGVILAPEGGAIDAFHLFSGGEQLNSSSLSLDRGGSLRASGGASREVVAEPAPAAPRLDPPPAAVSAEDRTQTAISGLLDAAGGLSIDQVEALMIERAVNQASGNLSAAARLLGITRPQLAYRLKTARRAIDATGERS